MKHQEVVRFLTAFRNGKAREYVRQIMTDHYAEAVLAHYPEQGVLKKEEIQKKSRILCNGIFQEIEGVQDQPGKVVDLMNSLSRNHMPRSGIWFDAFDEAYRQYKHHTKMQIRIRLIRPYFHGTSYCDIGCGGGDLVAFVQQENNTFTEHAGIDVMDWRTESIKDKIGFQMLDFSQPGTHSSVRYDTLTCMAVLHHVGSTESSRQIFLENLHSAMQPGCRLIIEEDVILPKAEWEGIPGVKKQIETNIARQPHYRDYVYMEKEDQLDTLILIDLLANALSVGVPDMPFPFGFRSLQEWTDLFGQSGYVIEELNIVGFQKDTFNRSSHVLFVLRSVY